MKNTSRHLAFPVFLAVIGAGGSALSAGGDPPLADRLGSRDPAEREQAMQGLSEELSRLDRQGDRAGLAALLAKLRHAGEKDGDLETRSRIGELLAPFSAGGLLWRCADLPGIVNEIGDRAIIANNEPAA